jgi:hypothetical protein
VRFLSQVLPSLISSDLNALLVITHLMRIGWIDEESAGRTLQRPPQETTAVLNRLLDSQYSGGAVLTRLKGVPAGQLFAYRLGDASRIHLTNGATNTHVTSNHQMVTTWAEARGRVSSAEAADLTGMSQVSSGRLLMALANDGLLRPGRTTQGRGFFYVPTLPPPGDEKPDL